jgi:hypothetical protein
MIPVPLVAFQFSEGRGYMSELEASLAKNEVAYVASWTRDFSWADTVLWAGQLTKGLGDTPTVILDAWDTIMVGTREELVAAIPTDHILLAGDIACWPDDRIADYPVGDSPWRYVNTAPMCGPADLIHKAIEYGWTHWPIDGTSNDMHAENGTDMRFWTKLFLDSPMPIKIDSKCEFSQCLHRAPPDSFLVTAAQPPRLFNMVTKTKPIFVHANGKSVIPQELLDGATDRNN